MVDAKFWCEARQFALCSGDVEAKRKPKCAKYALIFFAYSPSIWPTDRLRQSVARGERVVVREPNFSSRNGTSIAHDEAARCHRLRSEARQRLNDIDDGEQHDRGDNER